MLRTQAACRASTETIRAAAANASGDDVARLAVVGGDGEVLEPRRAVDERVGRARRLAEVVAGLLLRVAAQHALDHAEVLALVVEHLLGERQQLAAQAADLDRLRVERRLGVLDLQQEVEHLDVAILRLRDDERGDADDREPAAPAARRRSAARVTFDPSAVIDVQRCAALGSSGA